MRRSDLKRLVTDVREHRCEAGEDEGFAPTGVGDSQKLQVDISSLCSDGVQPFVRPGLTVGRFEGATIAAGQVSLGWRDPRAGEAASPVPALT